MSVRVLYSDDGHVIPHLDREGLCDCDCKQCMRYDADNGVESICICELCDVERCGLH